MAELSYQKKEHKDRIFDKDGNVLQEGTLLNAELFNKYEDAISRLVEKVNMLESELRR